MFAALPGGGELTGGEFSWRIFALVVYDGIDIIIADGARNGHRQASYGVRVGRGKYK